MVIHITSYNLPGFAFPKLMNWKFSPGLEIAASGNAEAKVTNKVNNICKEVIIVEIIFSSVEKKLSYNIIGVNKSCWYEPTL